MSWRVSREQLRILPATILLVCPLEVVRIMISGPLTVYVGLEFGEVKQ